MRLFDEQGFERTTVAEIAQQAGLTQRTFFNHFADKREVLFGLSAPFQDAVLRELAADPDPSVPLDAVVRALAGATATVFEGRHATVAHRQTIVDDNPELQERELRKLAALVDAITGALRAGGVETQTARLAAAAGVLVLQTATLRWTASTRSEPLHLLLPDALDSLRTTVGPPAG